MDFIQTIPRARIPFSGLDNLLKTLFPKNYCLVVSPPPIPLTQSWVGRADQQAQVDGEYYIVHMPRFLTEVWPSYTIPLPLLLFFLPFFVPLFPFGDAIADSYRLSRVRLAR